MARFFSIPKPCSENWNEMNATEQGAFCAKCTKEVIDCSSLKSEEIKEAIESTTDPCVRIFSSQIDEMNFLEWFRSLKLKKQLKYIFLFAFVTTFNSKAIAQDSSATNTEPIGISIIDIFPNYLNEDSILSVNNSDSTNSINHNDTTLTDTSAQIHQSVEEDTNVLTIKEEVVAFEPDDKVKVVTCELTHTLGFAVMGDWIAEPLTKEPVSAFSPPFIDTIPPYEIITNSNNLALSNSRFSFNIIGDTLHFMAYAVEKEQIRITIAKKGQIHPIYFNPVQIEQGRSEFDFPLHDFDNGSYIITIEGALQRKGIELIYW